MIDKVFPHSEEKLSAIETKKEEDNYDSGVDNLFKTTSKTVPAPRKAKQTKAKDDRIRQKRDWKFISEGTFKFYIQGMYVYECVYMCGCCMDIVWILYECLYRTTSLSSLFLFYNYSSFHYPSTLTLFLHMLHLILHLITLNKKRWSKR